jgi:predicted MFS family arabinose efflux permease
MAILFMIFFLGTSDNQMISPLLPLIAREFGLEVGAVGKFIGPAYALSAATAALIIGPISDKYGRRRFLLYASLVFGASLLAVLLIKDVRVLALTRVFTGLAAGTFSTCSIAYVADYFPYKRRGVAMSVVQAGLFAALVLGVPLASLVAQWVGWRSSFALFGLVSTLAFLLVAFVLPEDKPPSAAHDLSDRVARRFDNIRIVFESRESVASIFAAFFVSAGFVGFIFYIGSWLSRDFRLTTGQVSIFFVLVGLASLIGSFTAGPIADRVGKRAVSIISTIPLAVMLILIPRLGWGIPLFACLLVATLAFAFRQGPLQALATELVPQHARGALVSVRNTASQIGIALSTFVSGFLYSSSGFTAVGVFNGLVSICAVACIFLMREPPQSSLRED